MQKQAKALVALIGSALTSAISFGVIDEPTAQGIGAIAGPLVTYGLTWWITNR